MSIALLAVAGELALVIALGALMGLGAGTMDVSANTVAPTLVAPDELVSSMNALHMCFAIGALGTPLVVGLSVALTDGLGLACGAFGVALVALGVTLWRRDRADGARRAAEQHEEAGPTPAAWRLAIVASFFLLYVGLEVCFAGWVATYADELGPRRRVGDRVHRDVLGRVPRRPAVHDVARRADRHRAWCSG